MTEEEQCIRLSWEGKVPVCFRLDASETVTFSEPDPYFTMVSRRLYFPMVMEKVIKQFESDVADIDYGRIWLESRGVALKWHFPVGVIFDSCSTMNSKNGNGPVLVITIRFKNFPKDEVLFWPKIQDIESTFLSAVKEADAIKHRGAVMKSLQQRDHQQLWSSLLGTDMHAFWRVNSKLMDTAPSETEVFRNIPLAVHMLPNCYSESAPSTLYTYKCSYPAQTSESRNATVLDLHFNILPKMIDRSNLPESAKDEEWQFITHGILLPSEAELIWLSQNLSYADNFLHLILCPCLSSSDD